MARRWRDGCRESSKTGIQRDGDLSLSERHCHRPRPGGGKRVDQPKRLSAEGRETPARARRLPAYCGRASMRFHVTKLRTWAVPGLPAVIGRMLTWLLLAAGL